MDTLSRILDQLQFNGSFYFVTNFHSPWSVEVPSYKNVARFHYVNQGVCWVRIEGADEPVLLSSGDLVLVPHGARHILSDNPDRPPSCLSDVSASDDGSGKRVFQIGDTVSPHDTQLVCGHFEFKEHFRHPLVDHLPTHIVKNENDGSEFSWLKDILKFLSYTARLQHDGSEAIIKRLSEVIFIQTVRFWNQQNNPNKGFMAALNDHQLAAGLNAFHKAYAAQWTVEKLARESHMSRSLFAERFKQYLEISPMQYVTEWRMQNAKQLLHDSHMSIEGIALEVGYDSVSSFSKAFKRKFDQNPGEYRRNAAAILR